MNMRHVNGPSYDSSNMRSMRTPWQELGSLPAFVGRTRLQNNSTSDVFVGAYTNQLLKKKKKNQVEWKLFVVSFKVINV